MNSSRMPARRDTAPVFDQYVKVMANQAAGKGDFRRVQRYLGPELPICFVHHGEQSLSASSENCPHFSAQMPEKQGFSALTESQIYEEFELCLPEIKHAF